VGVGFQPNDFNTPGVKEHALFMKETADATVFKDHILKRLEEAAYLTHAQDAGTVLTAEQEDDLREKLSFVVVGGGPTGVELAGELTDFLNTEGAKMYGFIKPYISVHMLTYDLLNTFDRDLQEHAMTHLKKSQQVEVHLETFVTKVTADVVTLKKDGKESTLKYGTLVWCAGIKPHKFISEYGFPMNERGTQVLVDQTLRVKGYKDIFALGDCATISDYWLPQTAQVANQQGMYIASLLNDMDKGKKEGSFVFHSKGMMAYLGGFSAIMAQLPGFRTLTGFVAFLGWRFTYWFLQLSVRNRFMLMTDWLRTLVFGRDLTRFGPQSKPV
jgi:NADH:ubiquinone reductase (non-electrogenic)